MSKKWSTWVKRLSLEVVKSIRGGSGISRKDKANLRLADASAASEGEKLLMQLREAHVEWMCAQKRLDYVLGNDEVDYAIFALETAEKRYGMLLKQAKETKVAGLGVQASSLHMPIAGSRTLSG
jgi:hypothetical protein